MKEIAHKRAYVAPQLEEFEYEVEHGFASSTNLRIANSETVSEIQDPTLGSSIGENYHGEWF